MSSSVGPTVIAYTDGGCRGNPGVGGWGVLLIHVARGASLELRGGERDTTNNRMELTAVIEALAALTRPGQAIEIRTDSTYVRDVCSQWLAGWKKKGWRKRDGQPVKNVDLVQRLDELLGRHQVSWRWVRGHSGEPGNERADQLANAAMDRIQAGGDGRGTKRHERCPIRIT